MLKKAGIVVAASAAALLAVSPLAFAGEGGDGHGYGHGSDTDSVQVNNNDSGSHSSGLIAVGDVNALNDINLCPAIPVGVGIGDILGILSPGNAAVTPSVDDSSCVIDKSVEQDNDND